VAIERIRRVLLTFGNASPDEQVLRAIWSLLDSESVEMTGLYVEDEDLLKAAQLPCFREVSRAGVQAPFTTGRVARDVADEAASAQRAFAALAERLISLHGPLAQRFLVARGRTAEALDRAAAESDFVLVTRSLRAGGVRERPGSRFAGLVRQPRHVLFVNEPWASGSSVVVLNAGDHALGYAARLAEAEGLRLVVVNPIAVALPGPAQLPTDSSIRQLTSWDEQTIAELCLREDARLLVLPQIAHLDWAELLVSLMDRLPCSVLKLAAPAPSTPVQ
jgi:hypothetical protein